MGEVECDQRIFTLLIEELLTQVLRVLKCRFEHSALELPAIEAFSLLFGTCHLVKDCCK